MHYIYLLDGEHIKRNKLQLFDSLSFKKISQLRKCMTSSNAYSNGDNIYNKRQVFGRLIAFLVLQLFMCYELLILS